MKRAILTPRDASFERIKALVLDGLSSDESKRACDRALDQFRAWCERQPSPPVFTKAVVQRWRADLETSGLSAATVGLDLEQIQQRDGRWVIPDLVGKGGRIRTVPMPSWCRAAIDAWTSAAGIDAGPVFRPIRPCAVWGWALGGT